MNVITRSDRSFEVRLLHAADGTEAAATATLNGGTYDAALTVEKAGPSTIAVLFQGTYLPGFPGTLTVLPGPPSAATSVLRSLPATMTAGEYISITFEGRDSYGNLVRFGARLLRRDLTVQPP